jgi:hypothetical protein
MSARVIFVVRIGGGYLKALLPQTRETIFGCDVREIAGRLKLKGISDAILIRGKTRAK